jgi:hypothetical protein
MKLHPPDHAAARLYADRALASFVPLTEPQRRTLRQQAQRHLAWTSAHPWLHNCVGVAVLLLLFGGDTFVLLGLPAWLGTSLPSALLVGTLHGVLVLNIVTFSVHEGAAHDRIILGQGPVARGLRLLANNACRLFLADPVYYTESHYDHHRGLGTEQDGSFTHHVRPLRLLLACLPLAPLMSLSDYFPWRPQEWTPSRRLSYWLTHLHLIALLVPMVWLYGWLFTAVALLGIGSWLSFALDRVRESVEHVFLPLDRHNGTRELGLGFWGLLLGGGPWGQPCHAVHHLEPALAWYQQLALHLTLRRILTREQRRQVFLQPVVGFPRLLWQVVSPRAEGIGSRRGDKSADIPRGTQTLRSVATRSEPRSEP